MKDLGLVVFTVFLLQFKLIGQTVEPSKAVDKNNLQLEFETLYSVENETSSKTTSWSIPNVLIRYGMSNNIELQLHTPFTKERCFVDNELTSNIFKFEEVEIGASINLWKQNKLIPEAAIMTRIVLPTKTFNSKGVGNVVSLNLSNLISNKICLNYNVGTTTDINKSTTGFYVVNMYYEPNSKVHFFIENSSGFTLKKTESSCLSTGLGVNLNDFFTVDFSVAKSLKNKMFYVGAILTWVINTEKS